MRFARASRGAVAPAALAAVLTTACSSMLLHGRSQPVAAETQAPGFRLPDTEGRPHTLDELTADGPAVVVFYRGHW